MIEMIDDTLMFGGLSVVILIVLFFYVISRDKQTQKQLKLYERSIENINKNIFKLEKKMEQSINREQLHNTLDIELDEIKEPIYRSLKELKSAIEASKATVETRVEGLEEKAKEYMSIPMSASLDEGRVVSLFKSGYSAEEIAREIRANVSEVTFVLKLKGLA
ncbi:MAG: hypothetical protein OIF32_11400 [Campylobacterales bacterium]|nr:hypothetical protein [Campylobacterales bacterium]